MSLVGPHPVQLVRTFLFLAARRLRLRRPLRLYAAPLPPARVELNLPTIDLPPVAKLPSELRIPASLLRQEADQVLAHRIDLLGSGLVELGPEIDWHRDFNSGYRWPHAFYTEIEVTRLTDRSDAKVPWELSRCHHLLTLARAARLFEQERYALELESQLASWLDANPPGIGINWVNPMEVGIRAVNLIWAVATLEEWRPLESGVRGRLISSLRWHGRHIEANLEGAPYLRSNHYLGDLLGLLVLGSALSGEPAAAKWSGFARRELEREIAKQVYADGVSFEASLSYHGLVLEMFLVAAHVASWAGTALSEGFHERLRRMVAVSRTVRHGNGRIPLFGDQDSGRILPGGFSRPATHDNLLSLAAARERGIRVLEGPVHPEVAWTFGVELWRRTRGKPLAAPGGSSAFPEGGIFVLDTRRTHVVIRCGDVGQKGAGGHSHNDVLSYELSVDGVPMIVDSGTYAYTFDVGARNEFRSTQAHNTVCVDGAQIHPIDTARLFELPRFARVAIESWNLDGDPMELVGSHDGYRRLEPPCMHRRRYSLAAATGKLTIRDELSGAGMHGVESFLHLASGAIPTRTGGKTFEVEVGPARALISFDGVGDEELTIDEGWISDRYGARERGHVLVARVRRSFPVSFGYTITPLIEAGTAASMRGSPAE